MRSPVPITIYKAATAMENIAAVIVAGSLMYIASRQFTISRAEAMTLETIRWVCLMSLLVGWVSALNSIVFMLIARTKFPDVSAAIKMGWVYASVVITLLVNFLFIFLFPRLGAVAGPP